MVLSADGCLMPIGIGDGRIRDNWITASSSKKGCDPPSARLNNKRSSYKCGGWAVTRPQPDSYIQVDLQKTANITGVITQGIRTYLVIFVVNYFFKPAVSNPFVCC